MKFLSVTILVAASALFAACSSLENPFGGLFHTGRDERVYNPQTGEWEWPAGKATPKPQKSAAVAGALQSTPAPQSGGDGRYFDAQKNEWVDASNAPSSAHLAKPKPTPPPPVPGDTAASAPISVAPTPAPPRPARETGVYNSSTGKIEWGQTSVASAPTSAPAPAPARVKHWWWPF